ncbi:MAG TPA: DUF4340 domain-containing protein [Chthoniobacterales bacterium]
MNSRQLTLILIVAVVLGAIGWVIFHRGERSWESQPASNDAKILEFPLNDVAHIVIKDGTGEVNLFRKADVWVVRERADYPANFEQVSRFLQKIWNLKPVQTLQVGPTQLARFDLVEPAKDAKSTGTLLELKNKDDKLIAGLLAGKQYMKEAAQSFGPTQYPAGRYIMPVNDSKRVALVSDPIQDLVTKPERWLDRDFVKIVKPKSIALDGTAPGQKWKLLRENDSAQWKFADAKPDEALDESKASALANSVSALNFTDVGDPQTALEDPSTVTIETEDGFTYTLKIGQLKGETYPLKLTVEAIPLSASTPLPNEKPEEQKKREEEFAKKKKTLEEKLAKEKKFEGRPFLVNKFAVEQLLKNRADLIKTEPSPTPSAAPGKPLVSPPVRALPPKPPAGKATRTPARHGQP